jgi:flagellar hook-basal body complex protein FliE
MNDDALAALAPVSSYAPLSALAPTVPFAPIAPDATPVGNLAGPVNDFGSWFQSQLSGVNGQLLQVDHEMQTVALGGTQNLHQFMIHMEEAKLSFQLLVQVRNRVLESYQEVMRMQV